LAAYWVVVFRLADLSKKRLKRLSDLHPNASKEKAVLGITWTSKEDKIQDAMNDDYSSWSGVIGNHASSLFMPPKKFTSKISALRYKLKCLQKLRKSCHCVYHYDPQTHHVYVVRLDPPVWKVPSFQKQNGDRQPPFKGYLYVGQTSKHPDDRYRIHKAKKNGKPHPDSSKKIVHPHGLGLEKTLMSTYANSQYTLLDSLLKERELAELLKGQGYATYYN
tara:strand:- start:2407 stop:3066 length:660 start_codon:yes stop_codon:yes gene_type:complete